MTRLRQAALPGFELGDYIRESVAFLREHEPPEGFFVGFSGGKDSIVTLALCRLAGVRHTAFYSCTRIDPPEVVRHIRREYPEVVWLYPRMSMWEGVRRYGPPLRYRRWCCDMLKKQPARLHPLKHRVMGLRAEESARRAARPRIEAFRGQTVYKPIFSWPEWAVWEAVEALGLSCPREPSGRDRRACGAGPVSGALLNMRPEAGGRRMPRREKARGSTPAPTPTGRTICSILGNRREKWE